MKVVLLFKNHCCLVKADQESGTGAVDGTTNIVATESAKIANVQSVGVTVITITGGCPEII